MSNGTVNRIARKLGLAKRYEEIKRERDTEIVGGYKNGVAIRELAERFAISEADVCLIARKAGLRRYKRWQDNIDEILAYRRTHTQRETMEKFNFSRSTLYRIEAQRDAQ